MHRRHSVDDATAWRYPHSIFSQEIKKPPRRTLKRVRERRLFLGVNGVTAKIDLVKIEVKTEKQDVKNETEAGSQ